MVTHYSRVSPTDFKMTACSFHINFERLDITCMYKNINEVPGKHLLYIYMYLLSCLKVLSHHSCLVLQDRQQQGVTNNIHILVTQVKPVVFGNVTKNVHCPKKDRKRPSQ